MRGELPTVDVAVGVITKDNLFFVCRRKSHQHQGDKWEFPGGKIETNETVDEALKRELMEEIGIKVSSSIHLMEITFTYSDKRVCLHVHIVNDFSGLAHGAEGQESKWVDFKTLQGLDFPAANKQIIQKLKESQ